MLDREDLPLDGTVVTSRGSRTVAEHTFPNGSFWAGRRSAADAVDTQGSLR